MSALSELIREGPAYKKAALAVVVTAGLGACVYAGYRCVTGAKKPGRRPSKTERKATSPSKEKQPTPKKEEQLVAKPEAVKTEPMKVSYSPKLGVSHVGTPLRVDELSTSGTFEKISLAPSESDNFEHLTMSQVQPLESLPVMVEKEEVQAEELVSSTTFPQIKSEAGASMLSRPETFEDVSLSQVEPLMSFISTAEVEEETRKPEEPEPSELYLGVGAAAGSLEDSSSIVICSDKFTEVSDSLLDVGGQAAAASGVRLKDENDIVVVEPNSEESGSEKSEEDKGPRSGMASTDFDASSISPVFGQHSYHKVDVEPEELDEFDPAKSHPASVGFKFDSNI